MLRRPESKGPRGVSPRRIAGDMPPATEPVVNFPTLTLNPTFNITRASHVVLGVRDLAKSKVFYCDMMGFAVTAEENDTLYLRGLEEGCHHSLTLRKSECRAACASACASRPMPTSIRSRRTSRNMACRGVRRSGAPEAHPSRHRSGRHAA